MSAKCGPSSSTVASGSCMSELAALYVNPS
jgi:hypothetical protein